MINDILCATGTAATTFAVSTEVGTPWYVSLIASILSAIAFAVFNIIGKIFTSALKKKGIISSKDKQKIDNTLDDLTDDGKINNSNVDNEEK